MLVFLNPHVGWDPNEVDLDEGAQGMAIGRLSKAMRTGGCP